MIRNNLKVYRDIVLIRHGERLDEAKKEEWKKLLASEVAKARSSTSINGTSRDTCWIKSDPPLTLNGHRMAKNVGLFISNGMRAVSVDTRGNSAFAPAETNPRNHEFYIYSSKLRRAVQTAYGIAKSVADQKGINVHIVVSTGLAEACAAVRKSKGIRCLMNSSSIFGLL